MKPQWIGVAKNRFCNQLEREKKQYAAGGKPPVKIKNRLQRTAVNWLAGFFALMLLFSLASRVSDGVTVARVAVDTIKSGDITNRITINGSLKPMEDQDVVLPEDIYVNSIKVKEGERVKAGDVLLEFDQDGVQERLAKLKDDLAVIELKLEVARNGSGNDGSTSITVAEKELKQAKEDYERLQKKTNRMAKRVREDVNSAKTELTDAKKAYKKVVHSAKEDLVASAKAKLDAAGDALETTRESAEEAIGNAKFSYDAAFGQDPNSLECTRAKETWERTKTQWEKKIAKDEKALSDAKKEFNQVKSTKDVSDGPDVVSAKGAVEAAEKALLSANRAKEDNRISGEEQLLAAKRAIDNASNNLEKIKKEEEEKSRTYENGLNQSEMDRITYQMEKRGIEESIALLEDIADSNGRLPSPVDGTILSIAQVGKTLQKVPVVVISRDGLGFTFEGTLESKMVEKLATGDKGTLSYVYEGKEVNVEAVITSIGAVDEEDNAPITALLPEGSYLSGTAASMTVEKQSERQTACLPIGALRSDSDDSFVLALKEKKTVMGTEYYVEPVPVTVLESDNEYVSVDSSLTRDDPVVVSSNKVIEEGDRVRLEKE